ncbi:sensor histidine kinase [Paenibacillus guangzhouensis]|uniref:sensor histidine kinase n=1 Tax=Paenibacillus guangzhouensis TaxID=1473112 RepID=UPI00187B79A0|nr:histidine kinase [Paenibacillus guangzhouensis]
MNVLREEIQMLRQKDVNFLSNEINSRLESLYTMAFLLSEDINIQQLRHIHLLKNDFDRNTEKLRLLEKMRMLNVSGRWDTQYSVFAPENGNFVSTNSNAVYDMEELKRIITPSWELKKIKYGGILQDRFVRHVVQPRSSIKSIEKAGLIVETSFPTAFLVKELDAFKIGGKGDTFLYNPKYDPITNRTVDMKFVHKLLSLIKDINLSTYQSQEISVGSENFMLSVARIPSLGWFLIDYVPMEQTIAPIEQSRNLFYGSVTLLLILSLLAGFLLYRNVQKPIGVLIRNVDRLKNGDYSTRISFNPKNEFTFLFDKFNQMALEIEQLIETVYIEKIRNREAKLKQLQSQINPHFLYNCFALILSLTRLGKKQSVIDMTFHLSKYYRYTTRIDSMSATIAEEIALIENYLTIQEYHISHLSYTIEMPEEMLNLHVPRLLLQPIVENAIIHGIEQFVGDGMVSVHSIQDDTSYIIIIENNGIPMTNEQLAALQLGDSRIEISGHALDNIQQRLKLQFGEQAGIVFKHREGGGTVVTMSWPKNNKGSH